MSVDNIQRESNTATMEIALCNKEKGDEMEEKLFEFQQTLTTSKLMSNRVALSLSITEKVARGKFMLYPNVTDKSFYVLKEKLYRIYEYGHQYDN